MSFNEKYKLVKRIVKEIQLLDVETIQVKFYNYPDVIVKYYRYVNRHFTDWYVNKFFINDKPISLPKIKKP